MPLTPGQGIAIAGSIDNASNNIAQASINRQTRKYNEKWNYINRQWALDDYQMQNEYNHPSSQMARLKEAKLNPNLIYGDSASMATAAPIKSGGNGSWQPRPPTFNSAGAATAGLMAHADLEIKKAQLDNLRTANTVALEEAQLKRAQTVSTLQGVDVSKFDLGLKSDIRTHSVDAARLQNESIKANMKSTLDANERAAALQSPTLMAAIERVTQMRLDQALTRSQRDQILTTIENLKKDGILKELDIELRRLGIGPNSGLIPSLVGRLLGNPKTWPDKARKMDKALHDYLPDFLLDWWKSPETLKLHR